MPEANKKLRKALTSTEIPTHAEKLKKHRRREGRRGKLKGKTFEALSQQEKDTLLKQLAIQAGLLEDSEDQN